MTEKNLNEVDPELTECDDELQSLVLIDEEGKEHGFDLIDVLEVEGAQYVVLLPQEQEEGEEEEAVIMRLQIDEAGEETFASIENDEEWDKVVTAYNDTIWEEDE